MNDGALPAAIGQFWMIRSVNHVEHNRTRTEVEWHTVAYAQVWITDQVSRKAARYQSRLIPYQQEKQRRPSDDRMG